MGQKKRRKYSRSLLFETLEERTVLSAGGLGLEPPPSGAVADYGEFSSPALQGELEQLVTVSAVTLRINGGSEVTVTTSSEPVFLSGGDLVEVIGIDYEVHEAAAGLDGVIAVEGYLHKLDATNGPGALDYSDGRFGSPATTEPLAPGLVHHDGLEGSWTVEEGWNRLSLVMVRYFGDASAVATNFSVKLQVGQPEFEIDEGALKRIQKQRFRVGETAQINIEWGNLGAGRYHNYLEMDVAHIDDLDNPEWVGVSVATLGPGETVREVLANDVPADPFSHYWTPARAGEYRLLIAVDPEEVWQEASEDDNRVELWVTVEAAKGKDKGGGGGKGKLKKTALESPVNVADTVEPAVVAPPVQSWLAPQVASRSGYADPLTDLSTSSLRTTTTDDLLDDAAGTAPGNATDRGVGAEFADARARFHRPTYATRDELDSIDQLLSAGLADPLADESDPLNQSSP